MTTRIAASGLETLAVLDAPVAELHRRQFGRLSAAGRKRLIVAVEKLRGQAPPLSALSQEDRAGDVPRLARERECGMDPAGRRENPG